MEQLKSWETKKKIFALFGILSALLTVGNLFIPIFSGDLSSIIETLKIGNNEVFGLYSNGISLVGFAVACIKIVNSFGKVLGSLSGVYIAIAVFVGIIALFSLINLIAALCKKPVLSMVFSILIFIFAIAEFGFYSITGLLEGTGYSIGPALYIYIACFIVSFIVDILMIVANTRIKKLKAQNNINAK